MCFYLFLSLRGPCRVNGKRQQRTCRIATGVLYTMVTILLIMAQGSCVAMYDTLDRYSRHMCVGACVRVTHVYTDFMVRRHPLDRV